MSKAIDSKMVYAQSSDIKSRTYLEYRFDMKTKAIAELEVINWFCKKLKEQHKTNNVVVKKDGGDAHMWFLRNGGVSGLPDYIATINNAERYFEFQYTNQEDLKFFDFKVSKVGKKTKGIRKPHTDREFLYIIKPSKQFAVFSPAWIMENGVEAGVPAWGNRTAFRIPSSTFKEILSSDKDLEKVIALIDKKNLLLKTQSFFIDNQQKILANSLQNIVDQEQTFKIIPKTLFGFYQACFLLDQIKKQPVNYLLWLVYASSFYTDNMSSADIAKLIYCLDFLYGKAEKLEQNVLESFIQVLQKINNYIVQTQNNSLQTCTDLSPREEVVNFLFIVNLFEDIVQELRHIYKVDCFSPINKIFQTVENIDFIVTKIRI